MCKDTMTQNLEKAGYSASLTSESKTQPSHFVFTGGALSFRAVDKQTLQKVS